MERLDQQLRRRYRKLAKFPFPLFSTASLRVIGEECHTPLHVFKEPLETGCDTHTHTHTHKHAQLRLWLACKADLFRHVAQQHARRVTSNLCRFQQAGPRSPNRNFRSRATRSTKIGRQSISKWLLSRSVCHKRDALLNMLAFNSLVPSLELFCVYIELRTRSNTSMT